DFTMQRIDKGETYFIWNNRAALTVIPESLELSPLEFFELLAHEEIKSEDRALVEKLKRKINHSFKLGISPQDEDRIVEIVKGESTKNKPFNPVLDEWFSLDISVKYPEILESMLRHENFLTAWDGISLGLKKATWLSRPDLVEEMFGRKDALPQLIREV